LQKRPQSLSIRPPQNGGGAIANIGFVCFHKGLPVNDFRYLSGDVAIDRDWSDPWYSQFHNPNLRRQFNAPLSAYLYIEPFEVRKEIIVRPVDLQAWLDLGLQDDAVIRVSQQGTLKDRIAQFLSNKNPVSINGLPAEGRLDRIHFIRRTLRSTGIIEPAVDLDASSAILGVIFVYPIDRLPAEVSMKWELFLPEVQSVPVVASDEAGGLPSEVTPDDPLLVWKNYLTNPTSPQMMAVGRLPSNRRMSVPLLSACCAGIAFGSLVVLATQWRSGRVLSRQATVAVLASIIVGVMSLSVARVSIPTPDNSTPQRYEQASKQFLRSLLHNVYRSFDHHDDNLVYDRLAQSISGDLLSDVYLETRKSMEVKNQGGLRISVKDVDVTELDSTDSASAEPSFRCRWRVTGWIGHWGHIHARTNEHLALITIAERDGVWKISGLEMLDEQSAEPLRTPSPDEQGSGV
jgi:hypothetical protein